MLNDPVLDELIHRAHQNNNNLRIAALRVLESRALLGLAIGSQYPQGQVVFGDATALSSSESNANTKGGGDLSFSQYNLGVSATDQDETRAEEKPDESEEGAQAMDPMRKSTLIILGICVVLMFWYLVAHRITPFTSQARVHARVVPVASEVSGTVTDVRVTNNQAVRASDPLFDIERDLYQFALDTALRSLVIVMPILMIFLLSSSSASYLAVMIKVASMGQQASGEDSKKIGKSLLLSTLIGGKLEGDLRRNSANPPSRRTIRDHL